MSAESLFPWKVLHVRETDRRLEDAIVPAEVPLAVELNGRPGVTLMALPGLERELAIGFCLSEGLVASFADIWAVQFCHDEVARETGRGGGVVRMQVRPEALRPEGPGWRPVLSSCGSLELDLATLDLPPLPEPAGPLVTAEALGRMSAALGHGQGTYRDAGGVHGAVLFAPDGTSLVAAEDIGRHNAVDKVLGTALVRGLQLSDKVLLSTGRASHELVTKALRLRVPVVGSISVATSLAIQLAEQGRCTLLGRLRRQRFLVYTCPQRIG
jgi:FdhD protein